MNPLRYLLGVVHDCTAPLWCAVRGHGPWYSIGLSDGAARTCVNCGVVRR